MRLQNQFAVLNGMHRQLFDQERDADEHHAAHRLLTESLRIGNRPGLLQPVGPDEQEDSESDDGDENPQQDACDAFEGEATKHESSRRPVIPNFTEPSLFIDPA